LIFHIVFPLLGGREKTDILQVTFLFLKGVALSI
jgi:hypothetical protein